MTDEVAKLYAELGFKVNEDGLIQAKKMLSEFAEKITAINDLLKTQAESSGILTKETIALEKEKSKEAREKLKLENTQVRQKMQTEKFAHETEKRQRKEKLQEEKKTQQEQNKIQEETSNKQKKELQEREKNNKKFFKSIRDGLHSTRKFFSDVSWAAGAIWKLMSPALSRATIARDLSMYTGTSLSRLQDIEERFASVGSYLPRETIASELSSAMRNITQMRFNEGNSVGFKLSGIQGLAAKNDVSKVLDLIEKATAGIDNQAFVELLNKMGFSGQMWLPYFRARQRARAFVPQLSGEDQEKLLEANSWVNVFTLSLKRGADIMTAYLSPAIEKIAKKFTELVNWMTLNFNFAELGEVFVRLFERFANWVKSFDPKELEEKIVSFVNAIGDLVSFVIDVADGIKKRFTFSVRNLRKEREERNLKRGADFVGEFTKKELQKGLLPTWTVNNNQVTNTTISTTGNGIYEELEKVIEGGVSKGIEKFNFAGTHIFAAEVTP